MNEFNIYTLNIFIYSIKERREEREKERTRIKKKIIVKFSLDKLS